MSITDRRTRIRSIIDNAIGAGTATDELPDFDTRDVAVVVTWSGTDTGRDQWSHRFEIVIVPSATTSPAFHCDRDRMLDRILAALDAADGLGRPSASVRPVEIGGTVYGSAAVIAITATDHPITLGGT